MKKVLAILSVMALIAIMSIGVVGAQVWYPYANSYNYQQTGFNVYDSYSWYGNKYAASVATYNVYDHWGYSYGNVWTDRNSANWGYGSYWWL